MADDQGVIIRKVRGPYKKRNLGAHLSASERLERMGWDPLGEQVLLYRKLQVEVERQEQLRLGTLVELTSTGKARWYEEEKHFSLLQTMAGINDKMMRYSYARVNETPVKEEPPMVPLIIQLTDESDTYVIGDEPEVLLADETDAQEEDGMDKSFGTYDFDPYVEASDAYHAAQAEKKKFKVPTGAGAPPKVSVPLNSTDSEGWPI